jgi:ATP-dependent DNA helicase RecQ
MLSVQAQAQAWLEETLGPGAIFREGQWEAIAALVEARQRVLVVQRTGWGKSMVYFMATRLLRAQGQGLTLLISPLLALMRNQLAAADHWGVRAATLNSSNEEEHPAVTAALFRNEVDLLLISPERLANDYFRANVWPFIQHQVGLVVVDEAHCISDWGHDFRPDYRRIMSILGELRPGLPLLGTTATANNRVVQDVAEILGAGLHIQRGALTRQSLRLYNYKTPMSQAERLVLLSHLLQRIEGSGIIYCTTIRDCEIVADWLQGEGFAVRPYYSGVDEGGGQTRHILEQALLQNDLKALVASVALGMGFDKPDLQFVIHYQQPGNIISYYQQIGRAGRAIETAYIVLMHGPGDEDIQNHFIETAFPKAKQVEAAIEALQVGGEQSLSDLNRRVNISRTAMQKILTHLEIEGIISKNERSYRLIDKRKRPDYTRWEAISQQRRQEMAQMQAYLQHEGCLMRFIAQALDDPHAPEACGRCQNCTGAKSRFAPTIPQIEKAQAHLRGDEAISFEARQRWHGRTEKRPKTTLPFTNEPGIALCHYYTAGWSELVKQGRYQTGRYDPELVRQAARVLQTAMEKMLVAPTWVTAIPSLARPRLVPDFAQALAKILGLPYHEALEQHRAKIPQAEMMTSARKAENVEGVYRLKFKPLPKGPVLLVDDLVDSRWTLTVAGELLGQGGSGPVHPFVLATLGTSD